MTIGEYIKQKDRKTYEKLMKIGRRDKRWQGNGQKKPHRNTQKNIKDKRTKGIKILECNGLFETS